MVDDVRNNQCFQILLQGANSPFFLSLYSEVVKLSNSLGLLNKQDILTNLERLWLPIALDISLEREKLNRTLIQGVLGGQGTGKTTFCLILKLILHYLGYSVACLSIDDLYLTYEERKQLQQQDARLIWRGPPGTHDLKLGLDVLNQCLEGDEKSEISLPRFDKSLFNGAGDRSEAETIFKPDILLFEGWFVGVRPIPPDCFSDPPPPIITPEDQEFALVNNQRLEAYLPLWAKLDRLIVFNPEDYRLSIQWRKEAEHKMIALGKTGMTDAEITRFVEYFWKSLHPELFIKPLISNPELVDLVVEIKSDRAYGKIYQPQRS
ncbi:glycerate kinase [Chondrocystis sp. NIES-4102]|nr:glycerate kinase [Chondrocystis sp. NIES-4102]